MHFVIAYISCAAMHMSRQVRILHSMACLHRETMIKDRVVKWRILEKSVRTWK